MIYHMGWNNKSDLSVLLKEWKERQLHANTIWLVYIFDEEMPKFLMELAIARNSKIILNLNYISSVSSRAALPCSTFRNIGTYGTFRNTRKSRNPTQNSKYLLKILGEAQNL